MTDAIITVSRYLFVSLMLLYGIGSFLSLRCRKVRSLRPYALYLTTVSLLLLSVGYAVMFVHERRLIILVAYAAEVAFLVVYGWVYRLLYPKSNPVLQSHITMLLAVGYIMLMRLDSGRLYRQFAFSCASALATLIVPRLFAKVKAARIWGMVTGIAGFLLLVAVLVTGSFVGYAKLTIGVGFIRLQPSEFVKISFVLLLAVIFREKHEIKRILLAGLITLAHVGVLVLSRDLGAAVIYSFAFLMIIYVVTRRTAVLPIGLVIGVIASVAAYYLFSHVATRISAWRDPWSNYLQEGYQVGNSLFGIATGGWFGQGLFRGNPGRIPVVVSDFIFAAICEELGGLTGLCLIIVCFATILTFVRVASELYLPFYKVAGVGLTTVYCIQIFLNIGGVIRFIPSTGVTLPFISYGVNSIASTFILFGIMQELFIKQQVEVERIEETKGYAAG